jgi:arylsulfatase A-like enzyme
VGITENPVTAKELGLAQGFVEYHERWKRTLPLAAMELAYRRVTGAPVREEWTDTTIRTAIRWIDNHRGTHRPFFMFVNLMAAHLPNYPREDSPTDHWSDDDLDRIEPVNRVAERFYLEEHRLGPRHLEIMRRIYDQEIAYLDANLATLIADLEERALLDRTILVITSDHGENFGDHGYIEHQLCVYNSLVRVPLIIRFPDLLEPDVVHAPVSTVDLGRAVGALIEIATTAPGQPVSLSLAGFVGGRESHVGEYGNPLRMLRETLGADANRVDLSRFDRRLRFIIHDGLKLIVGSDGRTELYDLANDFDENFDLSSARPDTVGVLEAALAGWDHLLPDQRVASPLPELDDDALRQLESLGYVPPRADD